MKRNEKSEKTENRYSVQDLKSDKGRNRIAREFGPLMTKIVNQWDGHCPLDRDLLYMQAEYGLVYAMDHYKEGTSQSFMQYAAWCMRNWILNGISEFGSVVRMTSCERSKKLKAGESVYNTFSIDRCPEDDTDGELSEYIFRNSEEIRFEPITKSTVLEKLISYVDHNFNERTKDIFYSTYELNGHKLMKGVDLSKKYNCSAALISQTNRFVIDEIRKNFDLMELLDTLR